MKSAMLGLVMSARRRAAVLAISALLVLLVVAAVLAWRLVDADQFKERLETGIGEALDMEVSIARPLRLNLLPGPGVVLEHVEAGRDGQVMFVAERASVRMALIALLFGEVRVRELAIEQPEFRIERYRPGVYNFSVANAEPAELGALSLRRLILSDARLDFVEHASELEWSLENCDVDLRDIRHSGGLLEQAMASLAATGGATCGSLRQGQFVATKLSARLRGTDGVFALEPVSAIIFEGQASGSVEVDFSSPAPVYTLDLALAGFDMNAFMSQLEPGQETTGKIDLEVKLSLRGRTSQEIRHSATGTLGLHAEQLTIHGYDLDDELDDFAETQHFNLVDAGAVVLAGPLGLALTRGRKLAGLLGGRGGRTEIEQMTSEWVVEDGVAQARDVAFRTPKNRIALAGDLDFREYRFQDMRVAVIDVHGCAIIEQGISGGFRDPSLEQPNIVVTVIGPLINLVKRGVKEVTDQDCKAFYSGSIAHPE